LKVISESKVTKVEEYLQELKQKGYASGTAEYRKIYLQQFFSFLNDKQLNKENILAFQTHLAKSNLKPLTVHGKLSVLYCFLKWLCKNNYTLADFSASVTFPKKQYSISKRILGELEVKYFLSLPDTKIRRKGGSSTRKGIRDKAILELLYSTGMRRSELTGLNLYDLDIDVQTIRVLGKGRKERTLPVGSVALYWLMKYIREVRSQITKARTESRTRERESALFLDLLYNNRLSPVSVTNMVYEYARQSNLNKQITPHTFRHSCAVHLLRNGADIRYIQELLGHASPETTQIYTKVVIKDLKSVYKNTHPRAKRKQL